MKLWPVSNETFLLCDHGRGGPSGFTPTVVRNKEVRPYVQSVRSGIKARGNKYYAWAFSSHIEHASSAAAEDWLIRLDSVIPEQVDIVVELSDQTTRFILPECFVEFSPAPPLGCLTVVQWVLTFNRICPALRLKDADGIELNDVNGVELWTQEDAI